MALQKPFSFSSVRQVFLAEVAARRDLSQKNLARSAATSSQSQSMRVPGDLCEALTMTLRGIVITSILYLR